MAGAGVAVGVTRCSRGAANVPVEPSAGAEASEDGAAKLGGKLSLYTSCPVPECEQPVMITSPSSPA